MAVPGDAARFDDRAVGVEAQPVDLDHARQRAVRSVDGELAAAAHLGLPQRPLQAGLGAEEPGDEACRRDQQQRDDATDPEEWPHLQKPYPTEKWMRQSLLSAP